MSEQKELEKRLATLRTQIDEEQQRLANAQRDGRVATDRQAKERALAEELDQINADCAALKAQNDRMRGEVAEFPTETQVLKLERRVESLKDAIGRFDAEIASRMSAVSAYRVRRDKCAANTAEALGAVRALCAERLPRVEAEAVAEEGVHETQRVQRDLAAMLEVTSEREASLGELYESREIRAQEDASLTAKLVDLQGLEEREAPIIDGEAARHAQAITDAWQVEQNALLRTYDKLRQVNREQEYHIGRGSHVKREDTTPYAMLHEQALSSRQGHIATQLNHVREQVGLLKAENAFHKKKLDQLTKDGRAAREQLEGQKEAMEEKLAKAQALRQAADDETIKFRALRWELQDALRAVRNAPSLGI